VLRLILAFVEIAFHRRSPEDLPSSRGFFVVVLVVNIVLVLGTSRYLHLAPYPELMVAFDTLLELGFIWGVLRMFERERRFRQTATAVLGVDAILGFVNFGLLIWHRALHAPKDEVTVPYMLSLLVLIWSVDVSAFVLSRAVERPYVLTVAIMLGYVLLSISADATFFPTPK
jgi:hypothetical protein